MTTGLAGVTSAGEYRFLDLPGASDLGSDDGVVALSSDGTHVAYSLTGSVPGGAGTDGGEPVVGVAVYDTVTGEVRRLELPSEHGIDISGAVWVGDRLWVDYFAYTRAYDGEGSTAERADVVVWDVASDARRTRPRSTVPDLDAASSSGGELVAGRNRTVVALRLDTPGARVVARFRARVLARPALSPAGDLVAARLQDRTNDDAAPTGVWIDGIDDGSPARAVPDLDSATALVGWRDETHVVVRDRRLRLVSVDVDTGAQTMLVQPPPSYVLPGVVVASDALSAPTFEAPEPPAVRDPRLVAGLGGLAAALAIGLGLALWRRRIRVG